MLVYPELASGAGAQYPVRKRRSSRTVVNVMEDGREVKLHDSDGDTVQWALSYAGLTGDEVTSLNEFFSGTEGSLNSFTFLDPTDNLFSWSEQFDEAVWEKGPLLASTAGETDPAGTTRALRIVNNAGAPQTLEQTLNIPGSYVYTLSFYARASGSAALRAFLEENSQTFTLQSEWSRITLTGRGTGDAETLTAGLEIPAAGSIDVFGMQLEAQIGASGYKRTSSRGGIYPNAHFQDDILSIIANDVNSHSCQVNIIHANRF